MWWWWGFHSPPLAYSIIRYRVFSVSITSNNWTATNKEIVTTKRTNLHTLHTTTDIFIVWIATHLCWDDSGFSWCVPLEITEIQNVNSERSNSTSRETDAYGKFYIKFLILFAPFPQVQRLDALFIFLTCSGGLVVHPDRGTPPLKFFHYFGPLLHPTHSLKYF